MKNRTRINKRVLVATSVVVAAVAGLGVAIYVIGNDTPAVENPGAYYGQDAEGFSTAVDEDATRGAPEVVGVEQVQGSFGENVTVGEAQSSGVVRLGEVRTESATFPVVTPEGEVTFKVNIIIYESAEELAKSAPFAGAEETVVEGVGDEAHYLVPFGQERMSEQQVALIATRGAVSYSFSIVQQADAIVYDEQTARDIVLAIAKQANLDAVK